MFLKKQLYKEEMMTKNFVQHDWTALTSCQKECTDRAARTIVMQQEAYMTKHPEILSLCKNFFVDVIKKEFLGGKKPTLAEIATHFTRPVEELCKEINETLGVEGPPFVKDKNTVFTFDDKKLTKDVMDIITKHYPPPHMKTPEEEVESRETESSTFVSRMSSLSTVASEGPLSTPEPTMSEIFYAQVSEAVDRAIYTNYTLHDLRYDFAYVEVQAIVERAMEIPILPIREEIREMYIDTFKTFDMIIIDRAIRAFEAAWEKRIRKKLMHSLRLQNNFLGYAESHMGLPSLFQPPKGSEDSLRKPQPKPCPCFKNYRYNRYPKDRFGVYLPGPPTESLNVTVTPVISGTSSFATYHSDEQLLFNF